VPSLYFFLGCIAPAHAVEPADIESDLAITIDGRTRLAGIDEAMKLLNVPSVSLALIDADRIALARAYGAGVTPGTLYQAASLSKFVTAVGAMRGADHPRRGRQRQAHILARARQCIR
jgi:CubicO group peptidase (beta-lactamase class C family)